MVSTKMTKKEATEYATAVPSPDGMPQYSYGTSICLDDELLLKLGISELPAVGTRFTLNAIIEVTSARATQRHDGKTESSLDAQITDMELGTQGVSNDERAKKLWPDMK